MFAYLADHIDIPARFNLDFDALVAGVGFSLNLFEKLRDRILNADGYAARDVGSRASADMLCKRDSGAAGFEIPNRGFDASPRHVMAADVIGTIVDFGGALEIMAQNARRNSMWATLPRELAETIQLAGALKNKLRRLTDAK